MSWFCTIVVILAIFLFVFTNKPKTRILDDTPRLADPTAPDCDLPYRVDESPKLRNRSYSYPSFYTAERRLPQTFRDQLAKEGLRRNHIEPDGDCLFAAIADQLNQLDPDTRYNKDDVRKQTVEYIRQHRADFESFLVDESLDSYCDRMSHPGNDSRPNTWGGHFEIQAAMNLYKCNIVIHEHGNDKIELLNEEKVSTTLNLAYTCGRSHYDSCRLLKDSVLMHRSPTMPQMNV